MDFHILSEWAGYIVSAFAVLLFWAYRSLNARISDADKAIAALALHVAEEYVSVKRFDAYIERFDKAVETIFKKIDNVSEKLDKKADK
ncbi:hypothetical protein CBA19CS22_37815 [Caballeronia novacaledonica]|uniref:Uncharacterized protein n=1 Tax=Caballeronia novacaledonica TaxID=1544861 RepID=A0ACB5R5Z2_9BURK|nr:hypothetical protein CBA19CS22_37815 [Caballeronia novacaledonica]